MELWAEEAPSQQIQLHCRWQIFCIRRMGRSDVVARMLVELLDTLTAIQLHGRWQIFCIRRMGRSDVVARMLVELLDKEYIRAVAEAMAGLRTEEALQAVVQVSLTLASADRPDILADVSPPPSPPLFMCMTLAQLNKDRGDILYSVLIQLQGDIIALNMHVDTRLGGTPGAA